MSNGSWRHTLPLTDSVKYNNMTKHDDREGDRLIEALTIDKEFMNPVRPHYYVRGKLWEDWWGSGTGAMDVIYRKSSSPQPESAFAEKKVLHRLFGPSHISRKYDFEGWYKDGELHREDGPAYRHKQSRFWFVDGKLHRLDGPAVDATGHPKEYWINGQQWSPKEYKKEIERRKRKGLIK